MDAKFLIRLDDACPTMHKENWNKIEFILDKYGVRPIVAVIPNNLDRKQCISEFNPDFWEIVKRWKSKGWEIALHGYDHCYVTTNGGLVPKNRKSEFAGLPLDVQEEKIKKGIDVFRKHELEPVVWVAPSHTFDENTLIALKKHTSISIISDGIAVFPYQDFGFLWLPQQFSSFQNIIPFGIWTICLHPSTMNLKDFQILERGLKKHCKSVISINQIKGSHSRKKLIDKIFNLLYWNFKGIIR
ncbi:putative uncharacterized protein [Prevotella sp. CAG:617]|nr:putative uncharacterized protein [Prevotella sp. CAG:617]